MISNDVKRELGREGYLIIKVVKGNWSLKTRDGPDSKKAGYRISGRIFFFSKIYQFFVTNFSRTKIVELNFFFQYPAGYPVSGQLDIRRIPKLISGRIPDIEKSWISGWISGQTGYPVHPYLLLMQETFIIFKIISISRSLNFIDNLYKCHFLIRHFDLGVL